MNNTFTIDDIGFINLADTNLLISAVKGTIDLNQLARAVLASRGVDSNGQWVGFAKAKEIMGTSMNDFCTASGITQ